MAKTFCQNCQKGTYSKPVSDVYKTGSLLIFTGSGCLGGMVGGPIGALVSALIIGIPVWVVWAFIFLGTPDVCRECDTLYK